MAYDDKSWVEVKKSGYKIELIVRDQDWKKLATEKCTAKQFPDKCLDLNKRFGIPIFKQDNLDEVSQERDFLKKEMGW